MPALTLFATALIDKLDDFLLEFAEHDREIKAGVASVGDAAAYSLVWEFGNIRQVQQGPNTVKGINPDGKEVWLSIQAPYGYISVHENDYIEILKDELSKVEYKSKTKEGIEREIKVAAFNAAKRCAQLIKDTAPYREGNLSDSIKPVRPDDSILDEEDSTRTLVIGGEE